jgi:hypothetical protein
LEVRGKMRRKRLVMATVSGFGLAAAAMVLCFAGGGAAAASPPGPARGSSAEVGQAVGEPQLDGSFFIRQTAKITAGGSTGYFGWSVAVEGDVALAGALGEDSLRGAAYLFQRNEDGAEEWGQVQRLALSDGATGDYFGASVGVDGDTAVVGAYGVDSDLGAAYVYARNEGGADNWGLVAEITATGGQTGDDFGYSVAIDGDTIVVGAYSADSDTGAAYVFARNEGGEDGWGQTAHLTATSSLGVSYFGWTVAIDGDTIVVGAPSTDVNRGAAFVYRRNEGGADSWGQIAEITATGGVATDFFGGSAAIDRDTIAIGASGKDSGCGAAYLYGRNVGGADGWGQTAVVTASDRVPNDEFGTSVDIDGDTLAVGVPYDDDLGSSSGSVRIFRRNEGGADSWGETAKLLASDGAATDFLGTAAAVDDGTMVAGASGVGADEGAGYVFTRIGGAWYEESEPSPDDAQMGDWYARSVDVEGDVLVGGAPYEDSQGANAGSAYIFERNRDGASAWGQTAHISASDSANSDHFGWSVAIDGDTVAVGAEQGDGAVADSGAVYIFERNAGGADAWGSTRKITATDGAGGDMFGASVAMDGGILVVGAPEDDDGCPVASDCDSGSAYVFARNEGGADNWDLVQKITTTDSITNDLFGSDVAIDGGTIVVAAESDDKNGINSGSAYVFSRNEGGADAWGLTAHISPTNPAIVDFFGSSVDIDGGMIAVGAPDDDGPDWASPSTNFNCGAVYVFERNEGGLDAWGQTGKITVTESYTNDQLGSSVAIEGGTIVASALYRDEGAANTGAAYVFSRNEGGADEWGLVKKLVAARRSDYDYYGIGVGLSGDVIAIGAYGSDEVASAAGLTFVYRESLFRVYLPLVLRSY